jgi:hypothetical protein
MRPVAEPDRGGRDDYRSNEAFIQHPDGSRSDAGFHAEFESTPEVEHDLLLLSARELLRSGWSKARIMAAFGLSLDHVDMESLEDHARIFGSAARLRADVVSEANDFAESKGKVAGEHLRSTQRRSTRSGRPEPAKWRYAGGRDPRFPQAWG